MLRRASIHALEGSTRARAVLPFFDCDLDVRFLLVVLRDGRCAVTTELPRLVRGRRLEYGFQPRLDRDAASLRLTELASLLHFDPWWLMRGREDIPAAVVDAIVASNLAGRDVGGLRLRTVLYDEVLARVVGARVAGAAGALEPEALSAALRAAK